MCIYLPAHVSTSTNLPMETLAKLCGGSCGSLWPCLRLHHWGQSPLPPRGCGRQTLAPTCPRSNPSDLWACRHMWHRGLCRCDRVKDPEMQTVPSGQARGHHGFLNRAKTEAEGPEGSRT